MTVARTPPVRRSALEAAHTAAGARWLDETRHWPVDYGDGPGEADAAARHAGLAELGPFDKLLVRGPDATTVAGSVDEDRWLLGPDEVLVLVPPAEGPAATVDGSIVDVSSAWSVLRIAGPAAPAILAEASPVDLDPRSFAEGRVAQGPMANVRAIVMRRDASFGPGYTILVARDEAAHAWNALLSLGQPFGLAIVGPNAVAARAR